MISGKWFDMIVGVDIHVVMVPTPAGPVPTPLPHPFTGVIYDPAGMIVGMAISGAISAIADAPFQGPVFINNMPIGNTGTEGTNKMVMMHIPTPPGVSWAPVPAAPMPPDPDGSPKPPKPTPAPSNDGMIITGSKTVYLTGTNATRLGDMVLTCAEPVRLPSSAVIAVPLGAPVLIGGPPAIDFLAAIMGLIRTKWVSGVLHRAFRATQGSWKSKIICFLTGHPVDVVSGQVVTDAIDLLLPGALPLRLDRTYYSRSRSVGPLGFGWHHSCDQWIRFGSDRIVLRTSDGRDLYFDPVAVGGSVSNRPEGIELTRTSSGFVARRRNACRLEFADVGRRDGTIPLRRVVTPEGNTNQYEYDDVGRLARITDSLGRMIEFRYDDRDRITSITAPDPDDWQRRVVVARFEYDVCGDLVAAHDALGNARRYLYKNHLLVQEIDKNGFSFYFAYDGCDADARCIRTWGDGGLFDHLITHDPVKGISVVEDSLGHKTAYLTNAIGLVDKKIDPLGGETLYEWDEWGRPRAETDANGRTVQFEFDDEGRLVRGIDPLGRQRVFERDARGRCVAVTDECGAVWQRRYGAGSRPTAMIDPEGGVLGYEYDERGNIEVLRTPTGGWKRFEKTWTRQGWLELRIQDSEGRARSVCYDAWGRLRRFVDDRGNVGRLERDLAGRIVEAELPGRGVSRYRYDAEGNCIEGTHPWGSSPRIDYLALRLIRGLVDPDGARMDFRLDTEGRVEAVRRPSGEEYRFRRDPLGRVIETKGFDGRVRRYSLDPCGQVLEAFDGAGQQTAFEYEECGRLVGMKGSDGYQASFSYDPCGRLLEASNRDCSIRYRRDRCGRVVEEDFGHAALEFGYDAAGARRLRRWRVSDAAGEIRYERDSLGGLRGVRGTGLDLEVETESNQRLRRASLGGRIELRQDFDAAGMLTRQQVSDALGRSHVVRSFEYGESGELRRKRDSLRGDHVYAYDDKMRLASLDGGRERRLEYRRDERGHLVASDGTEIEVDELGRALRAGDETFEYDADGRLVARWQVDGAGSTLLEYDSRSQLRCVRRFEGTPSESEPGRIVEFRYDPFGRRIAKRTAEGETLYVWDRLQLALEVDARSEVSEYFQLAGALAPLCRRRGGEVEMIAADQIGVPQEIFAGSGERRWKGDTSPFGHLLASEGRGAPPAMRLPGQLFDEETGLSYGGARYYDAGVARFVSQDPMGLPAGVHPYAYPGDPLGWFDFWALYIIGLGRTETPGNPNALSDFAEDTGRRLGEDITTYQNPADLPILPNPSTEGFGRWTEDLIGRSEGARFNLDGIDDIAEAYQRGARYFEMENMVRNSGAILESLRTSMGTNITDIEIFHLLRRDGPLDDSLKRFFDAAGREIDIEDLRVKCGL